MNVEVRISNDAFPDKNTAISKTPLLKSGYAATDATLTVQQLAEKWIAGHSIVPAKMKYGDINNANWLGQQVFAIDFDNENGDKERASDEYYVLYEDAFALAKRAGLHPAFMYSSFSSTAEHHKFRMVFVLDQEVRSKELHHEVLAKLYSVFVKNGYILADTSCRDQGRLYYGGKELLYQDYEAITKLSDVLELPIMEHPSISKLRSNRDHAGTRTVDSVPVSMMHSTELRGVTTTAMTAIIQSDPYKLREILIHNEVDITTFSREENISNVHLNMHPYKVIKNLPLHLILGVPLESPFRCIMHGHEDIHPSASIQRFKDGAFAYFCYGCYGSGKPQSLINIIMEATGCRVQDTIKFIEIALSISLQTDHQRKSREQCDSMLRLVQSPDFRTGRWEPLYSYLAKRKLLGHYQYYLEQASLFCDAIPIVGEGIPTFYESVRTTAFRMNDPQFGHCSGIGKNSVHKKRNALADIGLLGKCSNSDHPSFTAARDYQMKHGEQYHTEFLSIPNLNEELLDFALLQISEAQSRGERQLFHSRAGISKSRGDEAANRAYAQDTGKALSKYNHDFLKYMFSTTAELTKKGWTTEEEIVAEIIRKSKFTGVKWRVGQFRPYLTNGTHYDLQPLNKALREKLQISESVPSRKKIIFPVQPDV